jgi:2-iminobutanoate/2-iminopropanoate deaminase
MSVRLQPSDTIRTITTSTAPAAAGPYAQAVAHNNVIYVSGQLPISPHTERIESPCDPVAQTHQILQNITNILNHAGSSLEHVLKATIFITRAEDFPDISSTYGTYFEGKYPARSCIVVSALPHPDALVEIELMAVIGGENYSVETAC